MAPRRPRRPRRSNDQPQPSSPPPPSPMPPGGSHRNDRPQRSSPPAPPPMPPGRWSRGNDRPQRSSPPPPPPMPPGPSHLDNHPQSVYRLPDDAQVLPDLRMRPHDPSPIRSQQTATPKPGPSRKQYIEDLLNKAVAEHKLGPQRQEEPNVSSASSSLLQFPSAVDDCSTCAEENQPAPEQTATPNPGTSRDDLLNRDFAAHKLQPSQRFEFPDLSAVASLVPTGLLIKYFVRMDKDKFVHTYPDCVGGPFESLKATQRAIDAYHTKQRKIMCMDGLSDEEKSVRYALYWYHDGTRKHSAEAFAACTTRNPTKELIMALLDQHNEDNGLTGDLAHQLEDIVSHKSCFDGKGCMYRSYSHSNIRMKTKGADPNKDIYFAEVTCLRGKYELYQLTCICVVKSDDIGQCYVCGVDVKHPNKDKYNHGRPSRFIRQSAADDGVDLFEELFAVYDETKLKEEEARVRRVIKEGKEARRKLKVDKMLQEEARGNLEVDNTVD